MKKFLVFILCALIMCAPKITIKKDKEMVLDTAGIDYTIIMQDQNKAGIYDTIRTKVVEVNYKGQITEVRLKTGELFRLRAPSEYAVPVKKAPVKK